MNTGYPPHCGITAAVSLLSILSSIFQIFEITFIVEKKKEGR